MNALPDFQSVTFLDRHIQSTMDFYHPRCIDPDGGFFQFFKDNGDIYDKDTRHLVSSTRFIFNYAKAYQRYGNAEYLEAVRHGLTYLRERHKRDNGGYVWLLNKDTNLDETNHCYGLAFVLLAYASAYQAGVKEAKPWIAETFALMERHFWDKEHQLYKDEISADWQVACAYRGQNANMHTCEAMLAAFDATAEERYLDRAYLLADHICRRQANLAEGKIAQGQIWEHYTQDWQIDWEYNKDDPKHLFRPWGFQPGHQTEWAKLLLLINQREAHDWLAPKAKELFDNAWQYAWDGQHKGLCYGYDPEGQICDGDKYFWVQAESFAAAAMLALETGEDKYWQRYHALWQYAWQHMIDHQYGAWYRILKQDNRAYDDCKSPAGKTDYHTMGACYEVISQFTQSH